MVHSPLLIAAYVLPLLTTVKRRNKTIPNNNLLFYYFYIIYSTVNPIVRMNIDLGKFIKFLSIHQSMVISMLKTVLPLLRDNHKTTYPLVQYGKI
jgi:hypothetical protein